MNKNKKVLWEFVKLIRLKTIIECFLVLILFTSFFVETLISIIFLNVCLVILAGSWVAVVIMLLKNEVKI